MRHAVFLVYHLLFYTWPSVVNMFSSLLLHELLLVLRCCSTFMQPTARVFFNLLYTYPSHRSIFYVRGSVHHSTIREEKSNKMQKLSKYFYSIFIWSSACFGRHTAHHQEPKTALAASGYSYVEGCWTCSWWTLVDCAWQRPPTTRPNMRNEAVQRFLFRLLLYLMEIKGTFWQLTNIYLRFCS